MIDKNFIPMIEYSLNDSDRNRNDITCPFGMKEDVKVYLDISLKKHKLVYPAVGSDHSGVRLTIPELEDCSGYADGADVCRGWTAEMEGLE